MEIICIEKKTFEAMMGRFDSLVRKVEELKQKHSPMRLSHRLDGHDVCQLLRISFRTLQSLRSSGYLPYIKINRKIWYNPADVEKLIGKVADPER